MNTKQFSMRCDKDFIENVKNLSKKESKKLGYNVSHSDLIRKAVKLLLEKDDVEKTS